VIVDASVVVAAVTDPTATGRWARSVVGAGRIEAPHVMPAEVCQALRRLVAGGDLSVSRAGAALRRLSEVQSGLHGFEPFVSRAWELRDSVSVYDAWYVALAESLDAPLATLDARLARAHGPRCTFLLPG
jgi:predicted nucleic acid-binding protein